MSTRAGIERNPYWDRPSCMAAANTATATLSDWPWRFTESGLAVREAREVDMTLGETV